MMTVTEKLNQLKKAPLFKYTTDPLLQELALIMGEQHVVAGETIVKKGDYGSEMFIITQGKVKVHDEDKFLAELQASDVFGELAALLPEVRIASVTALEDSILLKIDHDTLFYLMNKNTSLAQGIIEVLCQRTRSISKLQNQIIQQEKLASLGRLSSGIAHEIKNPLNFVINLSEVSSDLIEELQENLKTGEISDLKDRLSQLNELMDKIQSHGKRADEIIKGMLHHAFPGDKVSERSTIPPLIDQALKLTLFIFSKKEPNFNPEVITHYDFHIEPLEVFPHDLLRVFINIIDNACFAMNEKQKKEKNYMPSLEIELKETAKEVIISFKDNGTGIPKEKMEYIFQPFFTTKAPGEGTGLGLSISYDIITKQHGGKIQVFSDHATYSQFVITLPKLTNSHS